MSNSLAAQNPVEGEGAALTAEAVADAEAVVREAFADFRAMRWGAVARLVHPVTLAKFRTWQLENARAMERYWDGPPRDPEMPPEVAAWFEAKREEAEARSKEVGPPLSFRFAGVETFEQLESLSAEELFARHLQAHDPREQALRQARREGKEASLAAFEEQFPFPERTVVGSVVEDDSTVQVVYRTKLGGDPRRDPGRATVVTLGRTPEGWRILTGSAELSLFDDLFMAIYGVLSDEEREEELRELAETVISWPVEAGGAGRARITGYEGGVEPPRGLAVEVTRSDGMVVHLEIPATVFGELAELLWRWPRLPEEE